MALTIYQMPFGRIGFGARVAAYPTATYLKLSLETTRNAKRSIERLYKFVYEIQARRQALNVFLENQ